MNEALNGTISTLIGELVKVQGVATALIGRNGGALSDSSLKKIADDAIDAIIKIKVQMEKSK